MKFFETCGDFFGKGIYHVPQDASDRKSTSTVVIPVSPTMEDGNNGVGASLGYRFLESFTVGDSEAVIERRKEMGVLPFGRVGYMDLSDLGSSGWKSAILVSTIPLISVIRGADGSPKKYYPRLERCYKDAVDKAIEHGCTKVYFPVLGMGVNGWNAYDAVKIAKDALSWCKDNKRAKMTLYLVYFGGIKVGEIIGEKRIPTPGECERFRKIYRELLRNNDNDRRKALFSQEVCEAVLYIETVMTNGEAWFAESNEEPAESPFMELADEYIRASFASKSNFLKKIRMNKGQLSKWDKKLERKTVLRICIGLELDAEMTNRLIKANDETDAFPSKEKKHKVTDELIREVMKNEYDGFSVEGEPGQTIQNVREYVLSRGGEDIINSRRKSKSSTQIAEERKKEPSPEPRSRDVDLEK